MSNPQVFSEDLKVSLKNTYNQTFMFESMAYKKELSLKEAIDVLNLDEAILKEGIFGKVGGLVDKSLETVGNKLIGAKNALVDWVSKTVLGGNVEKKQDASPFDGAKTLIPVAKMAKEDKEGFFQKVAKMTGNSVEAIKDLYMKLEGSYEKIPLVGKIAKLIPKGWRTVVIGIIVAIVAGVIIYKVKTGQETPKAPTEAPKAPIASGATDALAPDTLKAVYNNSETLFNKASSLAKSAIDSKDPETLKKAQSMLEKVVSKLETQAQTSGYEKIPVSQVNPAAQGNMDMGAYLGMKADVIQQKIDMIKKALGGDASEIAKGAADRAFDKMK